MKPEVKIFQAQYTPFIAGLIFVTLALSLGTTYTVGWGVLITGFDIWMGLAFVSIAFGCFIVGFGAMLREGTPVLVTGSGTFPLADARIVWVDVTQGDIDPRYIQKLLGRKPTTDAPGTDAKGRKVAVGILALGGVNVPRFGIHLGGGSMGFLIIYGEDELVWMGDTYKGEFFFTPRLLRYRDPTSIELAVQTKLRDFANYKPGISTCYSLGSYAPGWDDYLASHPEYVEALVGNDLARRSAALRGEADRTFFQGKWEEELSSSNVLSYKLRRQNERIKADADTLAAQGIRRSQIYGGGGSGHPVDQTSQEMRGDADEQNR